MQKYVGRRLVLATKPQGEDFILVKLREPNAPDKEAKWVRMSLAEYNRRKHFKDGARKRSRARKAPK
jgi:hypothetical protein